MVHGTKRAREGTFKAPLLQKCFKVGDLVEAMYSDGCWVPGKVMATRARHVLRRAKSDELWETWRPPTEPALTTFPAV